jgi:hypothetical protein
LRLAEALERSLETEPSPFRAQLLREDLARLRRLRELAAGSADRAAYAAAARRLGWTQGDARTQELTLLGPLIDAIYEREQGEGGEAIEARVVDAWTALTRERLERLVGCLSTPVPRPED